MSFNWCHGPNCHKRHTTTRIRGVKGNKVLRTRKVTLFTEDNPQIYDYFCDQSCMHDYVRKHILEIVGLHPRAEALETPIDVVVETRTDWSGNPYKTTEIKEVDNTNTNSVG